MLQLHGTPLSHFTRKVRIVLAELGIAHELVRPPGVLAAGAAVYGDNPLLRVPTLVDGDIRVFDSDHIVRYLVAQHDAADRLGVTSLAVDDLNRLAAINGIMANEVVLILAKRAGADVDGIAYFRKLVTANDTTLAWLDERTSPDAPHFDYRDIALVCMWQHIAHYGIVADLGRFPRLGARVAELAARPSVATTAPVPSLSDAAAAGWTPG